MTLEEIIEHTDSLLAKVATYVNAMDQVGIARVLLAESDLPFSMAMSRLEVELFEIKTALAAVNAGPSPGEYEQLYKAVTPLYRATVPLSDIDLDDIDFVARRRVKSGFESDSVTFFLKEAYSTLLVYSDGDTLFADTLVKDRFLFDVTQNVLRKSIVFKGETIDRASETVVKVMGDALKNLKVMYDFDVEGAMRSYLSLLDETRQLCEQNGVAAIYAHSKPRHLPSLSATAQSQFIVNKVILDLDDDYVEPQRLRYLQRRRKIVAADDTWLQLIQALSGSPDWSQNLTQVAEFSRWEEAADIDKYPVVELVGINRNVASLKGTTYKKVEISDVIGQQDNVTRLGQMLYAFAAGQKIPRILLIGGPGTGKSLSLRALANVHEKLRVVLIRSEHASDLEELLSALSKVPYRVVAYVDDMHFGPGFDIEGYKTSTSGIKDTWPANVALVASINPESYQNNVPSSVKSRFGLTLDYGVGTKDEHRKDVFRGICRREGVEYTDILYRRFEGYARSATQKSGLRGVKGVVNGRLMEDFIVGEKALLGIELPSKLKT